MHESHDHIYGKNKPTLIKEAPEGCFYAWQEYNYIDDYLMVTTVKPKAPWSYFCANVSVTVDQIKIESSKLKKLTTITF